MPDNDSRVEYRTGDRVRVQIDAEATVTWASDGVDRVDVDIDGRADIPTCVPVEYLTPLRPPLKLYDEIMVGVDPEPPVGTVLVYITSGRSMRRWPDGWGTAADTSEPAQWWEMKQDVARVAWLPPVEVGR